MIARAFLTPFAWLYGVLTSLRNLLFDAGLFSIYKGSLPVVSVGNLSAGGNGKTPLCLYLAQALREEGHRPVILMRGYKSKVSSPYRVRPEDGAELIGDEASLYLAEGFSVIISSNRVAGAKLIEHESIGNVIILDDGFQHRWLGRDLNLITVDVSSDKAIDNYLRGDLLPKGLFRESKRAAFKRIDVIVFSTRRMGELSGFQRQKLLSSLPSGVSVCFASLEATKVSAPTDGSSISEGKVVAFCGLAQPDGFFQTLETLGFEVIERAAFSDHHNFSKQEIDKLKQKFSGIPLVCTPKDVVKIKGEVENLFVLQTKLLVDSNLLDHVRATIL